jgi:uroporphyrinogen decarboxylase
MTRFERLRAAFDGGAVDRVPISFWQHFPQLDAHPGTLTGATVAYQRRYDLDFVKLMPTGMYSVMDYGVHTRPSADAIGTTLYASGPIAGPGDWERLPAVSPRRGILGTRSRSCAAFAPRSVRACLCCRRSSVHSPWRPSSRVYPAQR